MRDVLCNLPRNVVVTFWRDKLHETFHSVALYPATAKIVGRQVARAAAEKSSTFRATCLATILAVAGYRTLQNCFVQFVPPQCRQNIARQLVRNISQCNSAFSFYC